jgi:uncharacterized protein (TIGR02118 family)
MARLVVLYKTPKDAAAFDQHYRATHIPLAGNSLASENMRSARARS